MDPGDQSTLSEIPQMAIPIIQGDYGDFFVDDDLHLVQQIGAFGHVELAQQLGIQVSNRG